jgi:hypothetical protein
MRDSMLNEDPQTNRGPGRDAEILGHSLSRGHKYGRAPIWGYGGRCWSVKPVSSAGVRLSRRFVSVSSLFIRVCAARMCYQLFGGTCSFRLQGLRKYDESLSPTDPWGVVRCPLQGPMSPPRLHRQLCPRAGTQFYLKMEAAYAPKCL